MAKQNAIDEIVVVPFPHAGHIFPATELSVHLARRNYKVTLFLPSSSSPSPHSLVQTVEFPVPHPTRIHPQLLEDDTLHALLSTILGRHTSSSNVPLCVIVDSMLSGLIDTCLQHQVPAVSFFTSGACAAALEHATWKLSPDDFTASAAIPISGLPVEFALTVSDFNTRHQPFGGASRPGGPRRARGIEGADGAVALLVNTCNDLERPFLDYLAKEARKPAWGVGPLLPEPFWVATRSMRDGEVRSGHEAGVDEKKLMDWLDTKPPRSVIYISFGSLVSPSDDELALLAAALDKLNRPFVWVMQPEPKKYELQGQRSNDSGGVVVSVEEVARRSEGKVIRGWAPQLQILRHPSVGGFVSHCGWNSTVEALVCGVPILAWPIRGDQHNNAKLVVRHLGVGCTIGDPDRSNLGFPATMTKEDLVSGIERLMTDEGIRKCAASTRVLFSGGFPKSSSSSLDDFLASLSSQRS
ncbi:hypothetical protein Cni_G25425 [Canna indica]|uniref:Glycosyltransferase n=1 Tax=Canna indica TaxID=4628 RepID=A0AAQ3L4B6_9LILI|nr:hypothetical protein Cni_G25425 [Canna indica]